MWTVNGGGISSKIIKKNQENSVKTIQKRAKLFAQLVADKMTVPNTQKQKLTTKLPLMTRGEMPGIKISRSVVYHLLSGQNEKKEAVGLDGISPRLL